MTKVLFLGGSKDGERMEVPNGRNEIRVLRPEDRPWVMGIAHTTEAAHEIEVYTRQKLRGQSETFEVFAPSGWTGDVLIRHLLLKAAKSSAPV